MSKVEIRVIEGGPVTVNDGNGNEIDLAVAVDATTFDVEDGETIDIAKPLEVEEEPAPVAQDAPKA